MQFLKKKSPKESCRKILNSLKEGEEDEILDNFTEIIDTIFGNSQRYF